VFSASTNSPGPSIGPGRNLLEWSSDRFWHERRPRPRIQWAWRCCSTCHPDLMCLATFDGYFRRVNPAVRADARLHDRGAHFSAVPRLRSTPRISSGTRGRDEGHGQRRANSGEFENRYICRDGFHLLAAMEHPSPTGRGALLPPRPGDVTGQLRPGGGRRCLRRVATVVAHGGGGAQPTCVKGNCGRGGGPS